jgi:hypothetical protein
VFEHLQLWLQPLLEDDAKASPRAKLADRLSTIQKLLNTGTGNVSERDLECEGLFPWDRLHLVLAERHSVGGFVNPALTMRDMLAYRQRLLDELRANVTDVVATERAEWEKTRPSRTTEQPATLSLEDEDDSVREVPVSRRRGRSPGKLSSHRHGAQLEAAPYQYSPRYTPYSPPYVNPQYEAGRPSRRSRSRSKSKERQRRHARSQSRGRHTWEGDVEYPAASPHDEYGDVRIVRRRASSKVRS